MKNSIKLLGIMALAAVIGFSMTVCDGDDAHPKISGGDDYTPPAKTSLTGTVTVTSDITVDSSHEEKMKLTADVSGLNGTSSSGYSYQWTKDDANISGATSSTYDVKEADYGKTVRVKVTYSGYEGEQFGNFAIPNPTKLTLTLKRSSTNWGTVPFENNANKWKTQDTGITIERENGSSWKSVSSGSGTYGSLNTTGATVTLSTWTETKFKMRTTYTFVEEKYYFKKDNASGSELFDLTNGTKTYVLENIFKIAEFTDLYAKEES